MIVRSARNRVVNLGRPRHADLLLVLLLVGLGAAWMGGSVLYHHANADSLLLVLVSLQRWTPFYWEQNRFGMLIPLLAKPFHHPLVNLLVQGWLTTVLALLAPYLVARCFTGKTTDWVGTGTVANTLLVVFAPLAVQFDWFVTQPYGVSISLAFAGLLILERPGLVGSTIATALMLLAHWVNVGIFLLVLPAIVLSRRLTVRSLSATAIGMAGGLVFAVLSSAPPTTAAIAPFSTWPHGWLQLLSRTTSTAIERPAWLFVVFSMAVVATVLMVSRKRYAHCLAAGAAVVLALDYWLAVGSSRWVELNVYLPRYVYPSLSTLGVSLSILLLAPLSDRYKKTTTAIAFGVAVTLIYGWPSESRLRRDIDERLGRLTPEILATGAKVLTGDYWTVWPSVFHANLARYQRTGHLGVYGLTYRSAETDRLWCRDEDVLIAAPAQDQATGVFFAGRIGLPLRFLEHRTSVDLFLGGGCQNTDVLESRGRSR